MKTPALLVLGLVLLAAPAHAQDFYKFTWDTRAEGRSTATFDVPPESGYRDGYGLASIRPRGDGGLIVRFEGVGGSGLASVEGEATHVGPRCVAAMVTVPVRLGPEDSSVDHVPGCYSWIGEFAAPESFVLTAFTASQGGIVDFASGGARLLARPSFANLAAGATLSGVVPVEMKWQGPLPGTPVGVQLLVDGVPRFAQTITTGAVTHAWDTRTVADGPRRLDVWLADSEGTRLVQGATIVVTVANTVSTPGPKVFLTSPPASSTVSGTVAVNIWVEQAGPGTNTFALAVDGKTIATQSCACAHVWSGWPTALYPNGSHTLRATVRDATGRTGDASIVVIVRN